MTTELGHPSGAVATRSGGVLQVLVVEGDADQRELIGIHLRRAGCAVSSTGHVDEAVVVVRRTALDLAIIDVDLPAGVGDALTALVRSVRPTCTVALSSVLDGDAFPGASLLLAKPFTKAAVLQLIPQPIDSFLPRPRSGVDR